MATNLPAELKVRAVTIEKALTDPHTIEQIKRALPQIGVTPERVARVAFTAIMNNEKLLACTWPSLIKSIILCAQYGLLPDGRQAHLVPYSNECTLILDYKGIVTLIRRSPNVSNVYAFTIYENDQADIALGTDPHIKHTLPAGGGPRGKAIAYYSVVRYKDGSFDFDIMGVSDVERVRDTFAQKNAKNEFSKAWRFSFDAMGMKTVLRRHSKFADISYNVAGAIAADIDLESGDIGPGEFIEGELVDSESGQGEPDPEVADTGEAKAVMIAFELAVRKSGKRYQSMNYVHDFVTACATQYHQAQIEIMKQGIADMGAFMEGFEKWATGKGLLQGNKSKSTGKESATDEKKKDGAMGISEAGAAHDAIEKSPANIQKEADLVAEQNKVVDFETAKALQALSVDLEIPMSRVKEVWGIANFTEMRIGNLQAYKTWLNAEVDRRQA